MRCPRFNELHVAPIVCLHTVPITRNGIPSGIEDISVNSCDAGPTTQFGSLTTDALFFYSVFMTITEVLLRVPGDPRYSDLPNGKEQRVLKIPGSMATGPGELFCK